MSLKFYFGPSGAGKSTQLYKWVIEESKKNPNRNYLIIVPDQFTMQTQMDIVSLHDRGGIMNIDVLSFGRLSHRILEEVGTGDLPVLDDTGKSLVIQKVSAGIKDELIALGSKLNRQGYIHEVKSAISEFMQYGISVEDVAKLIECSDGRNALSTKLKDLQLVYREFKKYIQDNFVTTEETLDVLRRSLYKSEIIKDSVVVFDGFTGFTPIQNSVIKELLCICSEVLVSITIGDGEDPFSTGGADSLFGLSKKTVASLERLCSEAKVSRGEDVFIYGDNHIPYRFKNTDELAYLEKNLFRYTGSKWQGECQNIKVFETLSPASEVHQVLLYIDQLIKQGYAYRDIAIVSGNLEAYAPYVEREFDQMDIPYYIDSTKKIVLNPITQGINSALELFIRDFSYEAVFNYLRSGMTALEPDQVDILENYVLQTGLRGYKKYSRLLTHKTKDMGDKEEPLQEVNKIREAFMAEIEVLNIGRQATAAEYINALYDYLVNIKAQERLFRFSEEFEESGDLARAKEYKQIYRYVMDLLNQIYELLGEDQVTLKEFADIVKAGFGEIKVGLIPGKVDRILVGDMERTRLKPVKVVFFMGANDGNIPRKASKGGIISDFDREFLAEQGFEMAPTPRQQMFIQKFYLYLNMTKPSEKLYLSYSKIDGEGNSMRASYLVKTITDMFGTKVEYPENGELLDRIVSPKAGARYLAEDLREFALGTLTQEREKELFTLFEAYKDQPVKELLTNAAFYKYENSKLSKAVATALYGLNIQNSVTRLEMFASCQYEHFLKYGLNLAEREEFVFESVDMGNIFHYVLETFSLSLKNDGYTWFNFPQDYMEKQVGDIVAKHAATYGETVLYSSERNQYAVTRITKILIKAIKTLQYQIKKGKFLPSGYEVGFGQLDELSSVNVHLSDTEKIHLRGKIDRVDLMENEDEIFVKIIDYKSGNKNFNIAEFYKGLSLQLVVYMNVAVEKEQNRHPDKKVYPGAMLYYHVFNPTIKTTSAITDAEIEALINKEYRMKGVINCEHGIIEMIDDQIATSSDVISATRTKAGFKKNDNYMTDAEMALISEFANKKIMELGKAIMDGEIMANPYKNKSCNYCAYKKVCGYDGQIPGYEMRTLEDPGRDEIIALMKKENEEK